MQASKFLQILDEEFESHVINLSDHALSFDDSDQ